MLDVFVIETQFKYSHVKEKKNIRSQQNNEKKKTVSSYKYDILGYSFEMKIEQNI